MKIDVLDHGYLRLVDHMGEDLSIINAAKVSFDKESTELTEQGKRILNFLAKNNHSSPYRHGILCFEVYAPMIVKNQWLKYLIGSDHEELGAELSFRDPMFAHNESSRRYITEQPCFYAPSAWRTAPENKKQGSGEPLSAELNLEWSEWLQEYYRNGLDSYNEAIAQGIAPEQARLFLPAYALYVRWRWTASLQGVLHFLDQRLAHDAQWEIQQYAKAVHELTITKFPNATNVWMNRNA